MRIIVMFISFAVSRSRGFKSWSDAHLSASNDDDHPTGAAAAALPVPSFDDSKATEQTGCPWVVPAVSVSL
jgi:hypothetical protein